MDAKPTLPSRRVKSFGGRFNDAPQALDEDDARNLQTVTHAEIVDNLDERHYIRGITIEDVRTDPNSALYLLYVLCSWKRGGYHVFQIFSPSRPRFFRDLDRLITLVRKDFDYEGPIDLRVSKKNQKAEISKRANRTEPPED